MVSDWDEIKRLAADFQKAQLTSTLQKLSERNCIEIVSLLIEKKLVDVIFTNDGKEYITPEHLKREVLDELYVNGGRLNLVEASRILNVDLSRIEDVAKLISAENANIHFVLGQLISEDYITNIAQEINEKLIQKGEISISDLTVQFDLPSEFLQHDVVEKNLGKIIRGRQDVTNPRNFFTQAYIQRCKAKIRGALAAIIRPTNVATILQQINVPEKIFHSVLDEIAPAGQLTSRLANAQYVPHIYAKMQHDWVNSFYRQNGFLDYDSIAKLDISDVKQFIELTFPTEEFIFLKRCAIGSKIIELTVFTALNECSASGSYVDLSTILPFSMSEEDIEDFGAIIVEKCTLPRGSLIYLSNVAFSQQFLANIIQPCRIVACNKAKSAVEKGSYQQYLVEKQLNASKNITDTRHSIRSKIEEVKPDKREERRKKASTGKAGGGSQGRETKTKSIKKRTSGRGGRVDDEEDYEIETNNKKVGTLELITIDEISEIIENKLKEEGLEMLTQSVAELYHKELNQLALAEAQKLEMTPQTNRRQTHTAIQEKLNNLLVDIRLFEKGLKLFPNDVQAQLVKHLLKSIGNDVCNELTLYVANECNLNLQKVTNLNIDQRNKIALECADEYKAPLIELNKTISKTVEDFMNATETVMKTCSMIIKKVDKKKDRQIIMQHKEKLCQQLQTTTEPALVLHLTSLILFTTTSGCIIHASGKFVSNILTFLHPHLSKTNYELLLKNHDLVIKLLQTDDSTDEAKHIRELLDSLQQEVKQLATSFEKSIPSKSD